MIILERDSTMLINFRNVYIGALFLYNNKTYKKTGMNTARAWSVRDNAFTSVEFQMSGSALVKEL